MPDSLAQWNLTVLPPPAPATYVGPKASRPELVVDQHCVFITDPDGNYLGFNDNWGRGGPLARVLYAQRSSTRDF